MVNINRFFMFYFEMLIPYKIKPSNNLETKQVVIYVGNAKCRMPVSFYSADLGSRLDSSL